MATALNEEHVVILLVGKTNSGKSSIAKKLCERAGLRPLVSYTTRNRRSKDDNDHIFVGVEDYYLAKNNGDVAVDTEIAGNYYYATKEQLYNSDLYTIDPDGRERLLALDLPDIRFVTVYITCSDEERAKRASRRGDDRGAYRMRNIAERQQFRNFVANERWDYSIRNQDLSKAYSCLRWISQIEGVWKNTMEDTTK